MSEVLEEDKCYVADMLNELKATDTESRKAELRSRTDWDEYYIGMSVEWYESSKEWLAIMDMHDPFTAHVVPLNDGRSHCTDIADYPCWCDTWVHEEDDESTMTVICHRSADGREFNEPDYVHANRSAVN